MLLSTKNINKNPLTHHISSEISRIESSFSLFFPASLLYSLPPFLLFLFSFPFLFFNKCLVWKAAVFTAIPPELHTNGLFELEMGIGVHCGEAFVGNVILKYLV